MVSQAISVEESAKKRPRGRLRGKAGAATSELSAEGAIGPLCPTQRRDETLLAARANSIGRWCLLSMRLPGQHELAVGFARRAQLRVSTKSNSGSRESPYARLANSSSLPKSRCLNATRIAVLSLSDSDSTGGTRILRRYCAWKRR